MTASSSRKSAAEGEEAPVCLVIMPVSATKEGEEDHFSHVYEYLLKPACEQANFRPKRGSCDLIEIETLKSIISADLVLCDISSRDPIVMYELGICHAFNLPVSIVVDDATDSIFDVQGVRHIPYRSDLRVMGHEKSKKDIAGALRGAWESRGDSISPVLTLLGKKEAKLPSAVELSRDSSRILRALKQLSDSLECTERQLWDSLGSYEAKIGRLRQGPTDLFKIPDFRHFNRMEEMMHLDISRGDERLGRVVGVAPTLGYVTVESEAGAIRVIYPDEDQYALLHVERG